MNKSRYAGARGASILANLVIVAMLGGAALFADVVAAPKATQPAAGALAARTCTQVSACNLEGDAADGEILQQLCQSGFDYTIEESKGKIKTTALPRWKDKSSCESKIAEENSQLSAQLASALAHAGETHAGETTPEVKSCAKGTPVSGWASSANDDVGRVKHTQIVELADATGGAKMTKEGKGDAWTECGTGEKLGAVVPKAKSKSIADLASQLTPEQFKEAVPQMNLRDGESDLISKAFDEAKGSLKEEVKSNDAQIADINTELAKCVQNSPCDPDLIKQKDTLQEKNADLKKQLAYLDQAKKTLATEAEKGPSKPAPVPPPGPSDPYQGPSGPSGPSQSSTFPPFGGQPPPGNQTPRPPGTCSAGQALCAGNTLYSRNNQCVDTPMQYCQYGCAQSSESSGILNFFGGGAQSGRCAPSPQQGQNCKQAPPQPEASGCQNGSWKPTYTGACVSGWQCVPTGGGGPLTAELSCQPQIADVGMTLAITYSCSSGTSVGSGFATGGAQTGTTTITVMDPPAGTNVATYGLTCTDQGATASKQCNVQIAKPAIVLVANPKSVTSGATSAIGWVTSGMQSCIISSPELSDFTAQHQYATNVNGAVMTPPLSSAATFVLKCATIGGSTRAATTTVSIL